MITNSLNSTCINLSSTFTSFNTEPSPQSGHEKSISPNKVRLQVTSPNMVHRKNIKFERVIESTLDEEDSPAAVTLSPEEL